MRLREESGWVRPGQKKGACPRKASGPVRPGPEDACPREVPGRVRPGPEGGLPRKAQGPVRPAEDARPREAPRRLRAMMERHPAPERTARPVVRAGARSPTPV